ncbi:hypothetical protein GQX73_g1349 [Xylaria multiplex]|uniref:t-SNARE coiled-coil homology domain-containing protein n=1 Tax=Xylaria multiplex TaxID=323545 RepID=A0A7C8J2E4_9PEZI|nr:hypothetical protein GQX73_g1349 [Xylaria multiplex]
MSDITSTQNEQLSQLARLNEGSIGDTPPPQYSNVDSAISMTFSETTGDDGENLEGSQNKPKKNSLTIDTTLANSSATINSTVANTAQMGFTIINGMPYKFDKLMEMGEALAKARRERMFPTTITPAYNVTAMVDDYDALQRLNAAREDSQDARDDAFRPDISRIYIEIQRKIQDRDLTYGEVAADSNVRARLGGFANSTAAETGMYNLMRHAVNSVIRLNNLAVDGDSNIVEAVATRVVSDIRATVQNKVALGEHGVEGVNMNGVMEDVFNAIENALGGRIESQADRLDANATRVETQTDRLDVNATRVESQANRLDANATRAEGLTNAQSAQVNAIAGHVNAIDNHVHAMGNNVNAMSTLVNSTNSNVASLSANVIILQTVLNMIPQMITKAIQDMLPGLIGTAIEEAFGSAISHELLNRMQTFINDVEATRVRAEAQANDRPRQTSNMRNWFNKFNMFKKRMGRRTRLVGAAH